MSASGADALEEAGREEFEGEEEWKVHLKWLSERYVYGLRFLTYPWL